MSSVARIAREIRIRDCKESLGYRIRLCLNCGGGGRVRGRRPKCRVCDGRGYKFLKPE